MTEVTLSHKYSLNSIVVYSYLGRLFAGIISQVDLNINGAYYWILIPKNYNDPYLKTISEVRVKEEDIVELIKPNYSKNK